MDHFTDLHGENREGHWKHWKKLYWSQMLLTIKIVTKILTGVIKPKQAYLLIFFTFFNGCRWMLPGTGSSHSRVSTKVSRILLTSISWLQDGCWSSSHHVYVSVKKGKHFVEGLPIISNWLKLDHRERDWEWSWLTLASIFSFKDPPGDSGVLLPNCSTGNVWGHFLLFWLQR